MLALTYGQCYSPLYIEILIWVILPMGILCGFYFYAIKPSLKEYFNKKNEIDKTNKRDWC